jgi:predicted Ser/Thr protein kinase
VAELIFDKYEIQSRLAVGGMGEVFYAVQKGVKGFERPVILKSLLPDLATQDSHIEQFLDEARVAATLNHPNVVSIFEVGKWNGQYFLAMEYIRGRNVAQLLKASIARELPVPPAVLLTVLRDAAVGLDHAHRAHDQQGRPLHIVHRDISPQNIMVRDDGVTKVVDFGIARAANRSTRTATGAVKGKLAYMSPEQLRGEETTARSDQYSLGIVLWEMATARRLFKSDQEVELIKQVLEAQVQPPSSVKPGLPKELDEIALTMLSRDPSGRFETTAHAAQALAELLQKLSPPGGQVVAEYLAQLGPIAAPAPSPPVASRGGNFVIPLKVPPTTATVALGTGKTARRLWPWVAGLALVGGVAGVGAMALLRRGEVPVPPPPARVVTPEPVPAEPKKTEPSPAKTEPKEAKPAVLVVHTRPSGAAVRVDGRTQGNSPVEVPVRAGESHMVAAEKPGFKREELEVAALDEGARRHEELVLTALPAARREVVTAPPAPAGPGTLTLTTEPWSKVFEGGELLGSTPLWKVKLPAGPHTLTFINEGKGLNVTKVVNVKAGEETKLELSLSK